ncbi:MAG: hypothetical protein ACOVMN_10750 [Flexibacteraceae bacterium]
MQTGGTIHFSEPIWRVIPPADSLGKPVVETRNQETGIPTFFLIDAENGAIELEIADLTRHSQWVIHNANQAAISAFDNPQRPQLEGLALWQLEPLQLLNKASAAIELQVTEGNLSYTNSNASNPDFVLFSENSNQAKVLNSNILTSENPTYKELISVLGATIGTSFYIIEADNEVIVSFADEDYLTISSISETEIITLFQEHFSLPLNAEIISINRSLIAIPNPQELIILSQ